MSSYWVRSLLLILGEHILIIAHHAESLCDNKEIIESNIRSVKISSPDYRGWDPDQAVQDYYKRIKDHERHYETINDTDWPFIKIVNVRAIVPLHVAVADS